MANGLKITDYTNRDYSSLLSSMLDLAAIRVPEWTDRSEGDLGRMLLEQFAYIGDVLSYYQDRIADESFLSTAVERRSIIDLLGLIGYTLGTPAPATAILRLTAPNNSKSTVRVDPGARFATEPKAGKPAVEFVYLPVTGRTLEVPCDGTGAPCVFEITVTNAIQVVNEDLGISSGSAGQSFRLAQKPVLLPRDPDSQDYLKVEVNRGAGYELWQKRGAFLYSTSVDSHFTTSVNEVDETDILLGDGTYGAISPVGSAIRATYLTGGGSAGNVAPGSVVVVKSGVTGSVTVTNPLAAAGGADRESIDHAKLLAPRVFRSFQRAVTASDYAALAQNVPGVERAYAVSPSWNYVDLYIVASGGSPPTEDLRARLLRYFETRRMISTTVSVRQPAFVSLQIGVDVGVDLTAYRADVEQRVRDAVAILFDVANASFGQTFYISKVYETVDNVPGVDHCVVYQFSGQRERELQSDPTAPVIQLQPGEFPRLGRLDIRLSGGL